MHTIYPIQEQLFEHLMFNIYKDHRTKSSSLPRKYSKRKPTASTSCIMYASYTATNKSVLPSCNARRSASCNDLRNSRAFPCIVYSLPPLNDEKKMDASPLLKLKKKQKKIWKNKIPFSMPIMRSSKASKSTDIHNISFLIDLERKSKLQKFVSSNGKTKFPQVKLASLSQIVNIDFNVNKKILQNKDQSNKKKKPKKNNTFIKSETISGSDDLNKKCEIYKEDDKSVYSDIDKLSENIFGIIHKDNNESLNQINNKSKHDKNIIDVSNSPTLPPIDDQKNSENNIHPNLNIKSGEIKFENSVIIYNKKKILRKTKKGIKPKQNDFINENIKKLRSYIPYNY